MNKPIEYQLIEQDGKPAFAVIPYDVFVDQVLGGVERVDLPNGDPESLIPHAVAKRTILEKVSLMQAWREHLGLTQAELASRMGVTQSAVSQMERPGARRPHRASLKKAAVAMGLTVEQMTE